VPRDDGQNVRKAHPARPDVGNRAAERRAGDPDQRGAGLDDRGQGQGVQRQRRAVAVLHGGAGGGGMHPRPSSDQKLPAADGQADPGDVAGGVAGQEQDGWHHVGGVGDAAQRDARDALRQGLRIVGQALGQGCADGPRAPRFARILCSASSSAAERISASTAASVASSSPSRRGLARPGRIDRDDGPAAPGRDHLAGQGLRDQRRAATPPAPHGRRPGRGLWCLNWHIDNTTAALDHAARTGQVGPGFAQLKCGIARRAMAEGPGYAPLFASGRMALQASDRLERGVLAGKGAPQRKIGHDAGGIRARIAALIPRLGQIAARFGTTRMPLALACCLAAPSAPGLLIGVSSPDQRRENLAAFALAQAHGQAIRAACAGLRCDDALAWEGS